MKHWKLLVVFVLLLISLIPVPAMALGGDLSKLEQGVQQPVPPVTTETEGAAKSTTEKNDPQKNLSCGPTSIMRNETQSDKAQQPQGCTNTESNKWTDPITIFTFFVMFFTGLTWWTYHGILTSTKAIERAYVKMSVKGELIPSTNNQYVADITIKNWGNTPARVTHFLLTFYLRPRGGTLPDSPDYGNGTPKVVGAFLVKDESFDILRREVINGDDISKCHGSGATHNLCILGYVDYVDKFGELHRSGYASWYTTERGTFSFVTADGYNYNDEQKKRRYGFWGR
jgi:uncharacterized protein with PQ loop repeat